MGRRRGKKVEKERRASVETRELLALFRESRKPLSGREIFKALGVDRSGRASVRDGLTELLESGTIIQIRNAFGLAERMRLVTGVMEVHRGGIGFVLPDDPRRKDVFVPAHDMAGAWHGDRVVVAIVRERKDRRAEGRVVRILERGRKTLTAKVLKRMGQVFLCRPTDPRLDFGVMAAPRDKGLKPEPGLIVTLEPGVQVEFRLWEGEILDVLGPEEDVAVQEALVKTNHAVPTRFPSPALDQAEALPEAPGPEDFRGREDLRGLPFVTIDGATARDFDDAVFVESRGRAFRLWVAIADVAHYVRPGTPLDREAEERGNSYYFPRSVEPMFPERLSNGLCSLNPNTPRLAMAVRLDCSAKGVPGDFSVFPAVIESHGRLTYGQVKRALLDKDEEERKGLGSLLPMLEKAERLARLMNARRSERGSLDFDLPEPEILFNLSGETEDIRPKVRHFGHQIIEEFMIAANEAVATFLSERELPCQAQKSLSAPGPHGRRERRKARPAQGDHAQRPSGPAGRGGGHGAGVPGQPAHAPLHDAGPLLPGERGTLRSGLGVLLPLHLAHPTLRRPGGPPAGQDSPVRGGPDPRPHSGAQGLGRPGHASEPSRAHGHGSRTRDPQARHRALPQGQGGPDLLRRHLLAHGLRLLGRAG